MTRFQKNLAMMGFFLVNVLLVLGIASIASFYTSIVNPIIPSFIHLLFIAILSISACGIAIFAAYALYSQKSYLNFYKKISVDTTISTHNPNLGRILVGLLFLVVCAISAFMTLFALAMIGAAGSSYHSSSGLSSVLIVIFIFIAFNIYWILFGIIQFRRAKTEPALQLTYNMLLCFFGICFFLTIIGLVAESISDNFKFKAREAYDQMYPNAKLDYPTVKMSPEEFEDYQEKKKAQEQEAHVEKWGTSPVKQ